MKTRTAEKKKKTFDPQQIQDRAYELYVQRGRQPGHEMEDWLQAEKECREAEVEQPARWQS